MPPNSTLYTNVYLENFRFLEQQKMMSQTNIAVLIYSYMLHAMTILKSNSSCHRKPMDLCASSNE